MGAPGGCFSPARPDPTGAILSRAREILLEIPGKRSMDVVPIVRAREDKQTMERRSLGSPANETGMRGFSLVETMAAVAMVGVMSGLAVLYLRPSQAGANPIGFAHEIAALCDSVRQRAVASRTRQMIEVKADQVAHYQATEPGMAPATEWGLVGTLPVASGVSIASTDARAHVAADDDVPEVGAGLPFEVNFAPDGTSTAATIFLHDAKGEDRARVIVYKATGSAYTYSEW